VHGQLLLEFQPIVDLASSRPIALEALVRWRHPELGVLPPAEFMPIAESSGAAAALGRWVVTQACTALGSWPDTGDPVRVNVNLATAQVRDEHLVDDVREAIATAGIEPSRLVFEVTEAILDLGPGVRARLAELANLGVGLSIDDFGTGYSSLARVGQLRLEELKIDRSLLETDRRLLGAVRSFATSLGLRVVMEGVQSRRELRLVRDLGFDAAQGYVIGRPMAADSVPAYLTRTARARPTAPLLPVAAIGA
jgi:EAL domain-containing protein (putative c-di-GMP-specific phosphodiesterase class I)